MNLYIKKNNVSDTLYSECYLKDRQEGLGNYDLYKGEYKVIDYMLLYLFTGQRYNHTRVSRFYIKKDRPIEDCVVDIRTYHRLPRQPDSDISELFGDNVGESVLRGTLHYMTNSNCFSAFNGLCTSIELIVVDKVIYNIIAAVKKGPIQLNEKMMRQIKRLLPNVKF